LELVRPDRTRPDEKLNRIFASLTPKMNRPDRTGQILKLAGPDQMEKIRPIPTLLYNSFVCTQDNFV
jgi:hypothetical protein